MYCDAEVIKHNRFYISRKFKEYENCTIGEYINKVRIHYTRVALANGVRQKEISYDLGFPSPANFWLWMQKHRKSILDNLYE